MNTEKPYSEKDYRDVKSRGLDLDNWEDYKEYYDNQQLRCDYCGKEQDMFNEYFAKYGTCNAQCYGIMIGEIY